MSFTVKYFNFRGPAEVTRVLFAIAKVEFTDFRYPIDSTTFACPEFDAEKAAGDGGAVTLGQSKTIERFVAKKLNLFGSNDNEGALIDMIAEHVRDIKQKYNDAKAGKKDAELEAAKA
eukprot:gene1323-1740_t